MPQKRFLKHYIRKWIRGPAYGEQRVSGVINRRRQRFPWIAGTGTALPPYTCEREQAQQRFESVHSDPSLRRQARTIFAHSGVDRRYLARPVDEYPVMGGFAARNRQYQDDARRLGVAAARACLETSRVSPGEITHVVFATTTGLATPSVDVAIIQELGISPTVQRLPLFGLGCAGGAAAIGRAGNLLRSDSSDVVLVLCVELCGYTYDQEDRSSLAAVSASLFGDGAAALVLAGSRAGVRSGALVPRIIDSHSQLLPDSRHIMGWEFEDHGFRLVLSRDLPAVVAREVAAPVHELLGRNGLTLDDIRFPVIHPGGPRVLDAVEKGLGLPAGRLELSRRTLADIGNMSSATVLFVLDRLLTGGQAQPGDLALILAPGPGFAIETSLVRFEEPE